MKKRILAGLMLSASACLLLAGCGEKSLTDTSVLIHKDGSVTAAIYEEFDTSVYSSEELEAFISEAVCAYNLDTCGVAESHNDDSESALSIVIDSIEYQDGKAVLNMVYASCADYIAFNSEADQSLVQLASGTVAGAKEAGLDLAGLSLKSADGTETISGADLKDDAYIVFAEGSKTIVTEGKITYTSDDVTVNSEDTAVITEQGNVSCIVFKK